MSKKPPTCDGCERPIRPSHHELVVRDFTTHQLLGRYHASLCQHSARKYFEPGVVVHLTYLHPDRCGPDQKTCDAGMFEVA